MRVPDIDRADRVPTEVIAVCAAVDRAPAKEVADKFRIPEISLLLSTTNALEMDAVPAVTPAKVFISAPVAVNAVPPKVRVPDTDKEDNVPTDVIDVCAAVDKVPANDVAVKFRIPVISLLVSKTIALEAEAVPAVTPVNSGTLVVNEVTPDNKFNSVAVAVTAVPPNVSVPETDNPDKVPTLVIDVCAAVDKVPANDVAVKFRIPVISLLLSKITVFEAEAVPAVTPAEVFNSEAVAVN